MGSLAEELPNPNPNPNPNSSFGERSKTETWGETRKRRKRKKRENQRQGGRLCVLVRRTAETTRARSRGVFPKSLSITKNERQMKHQEFPPPPSREEAEANPVALLELREHLSRERLVKVEEAKVSEPAPKMLKSPTVSDDKIFSLLLPPSFRSFLRFFFGFFS